MAESRAVRRSDLPVDAGTVFLVGIAGAGMRALATVFADMGWRVLGSDRDAEAAAELATRGIEIHPEADGSAAAGADLVVYSSAVPPDHPARVAAREAGIPAWKRSRALGALVNDSCLAAVAGTHGKTTVTAMLAQVLAAAGRDPLALVGGQVASWDGNARRGRGEITVVEADEYDRSFLDLDPDLAIVTSVEPEHLDVYGDEATMVDAYRQFAARASRVLVCIDEPGARSLGEELASASTVRTYGFDAAADYRVVTELDDDGGQFVTLRYRQEAVVSRLAAPGRHNAQNAGAALAAAAWLGCAPADIADGLAEFSGVERRLQVLHDSGDLVVVDDYAHHPTEVEAGIAALRSVWPERRLIVVFQPHLYSRTRDQAVAFRRVLDAADAAYVLPIYPAREAPIPGVTRDLITTGAETAQGIESDGIPSLTRTPGPALIAFMGAGDVTRMAHELARSAARRTDELGG